MNLPFLVASAFSLRSDRVQRGTGTFTAKLAIIGRSPLHSVSQPSLAPDFFRVTYLQYGFCESHDGRFAADLSAYYRYNKSIITAH
ncbi:MAG TPA: hypothetical protein VFC29_09910, partial [Candidatus Limnocylindrales bacterium]|nr:hypothetical protein [Candidatus Limnocylindrales bacterium]